MTTAVEVTTASDLAGGLRRIVTALVDGGAFGVAPAEVSLVETHISIVVLAGPHVFKFKKPVNFGFLDFSTLEARRRYCRLELDLNRRFSPAYYLDVVAVAGSEEAPRLVPGDGEPVALEYAVKMRRFPADAEFERLLQRGQLSDEIVTRLAERVATLHARAPVAMAFGAPEQVVGPALDNFPVLATALAADVGQCEALARLRAWTERMAAGLRDVFAARRLGERVRECHGDLHLGNVALDGESIVLFDCIEFNDALRCIDVISEVAFVCVDLDAHDRADLGNLFLNRYLESGGDYEGVAVLRFYAVYRALVRAKVAALRAVQACGTDAGAASAARCRRYIAQAGRYVDEAPVLIITHGLSGSGKSLISDGLARRIGAIRVRSDVERKRLHGLASASRGGAAAGEGIYTAGASAMTYARLADLAGIILRAGYPAIVDAAFLRRDQRQALAAVAGRCGVPFRIVSLSVEEPELRRRLVERSARGTDVSDAGVGILDYQLATQEPLTEGEQAMATVVVARGEDPAAIVERLLATGGLGLRS